MYFSVCPTLNKPTESTGHIRNLEPNCESCSEIVACKDFFHVKIFPKKVAQSSNFQTSGIEMLFGVEKY